MAAKPVFADTSFFFALVARRDRSHAAARSALEKVTRARRPIVTTDYVIDETLTLTKLRTDPATADALWARIEGSPSVRLEFVGPERFARAVQFFRRHSDHGYSFTDCTSVVMMQDLALTDVLTTDSHFAEAGLRPLLPVG
jgi:predicted nucleic acid-binding protein